MSNRSSRYSPLRTLAAALAMLCATGAGWWMLAGDAVPPRRSPDRITVVDGAAPAPRAMPLPAPALPTPSTDAVAVRLSRTYPLLSAVVLQCAATRCTLTATIRPPRGQDDLDRRQEMLLGGLAAILATEGYTLVLPFDMEEVDDNLFHLRAAVTRQ